MKFTIAQQVFRFIIRFKAAAMYFCNVIWRPYSTTQPVDPVLDIPVETCKIMAEQEACCTLTIACLFLKPVLKGITGILVPALFGPQVYITAGEILQFI